MKRSPQIEFFLKAEEAQKKDPVTKVIKLSYPVREYFKYSSVAGDFVTQGLVDAAIVKQHKEDYVAFKAFVDKHDELLDLAREQVGIPLLVDYGEVENGSK